MVTRVYTTVMTDNGQIVEFQIRTEQMHEYAERGASPSFHYNEQKLTDATAGPRLPRCLSSYAGYVNSKVAAVK